MDLIYQVAEAYAEKFTSPENDLLHQIASKTYAEHKDANMLSGHVQGKFLEMVSYMIKPHRVLEIGTFVGYSALCLSRGLKDGGVLHTIELDEENAKTASQNFQKAHATGRINLHVGNALEIIPALDEKWDLVFIDADKPGYIKYYELVLPMINKNGFILADNVLFHGEVLEDPIKWKNAKAINEFNIHVKNDDRVDNVILTMRDGLMVIRKK